jgi:hypothetical protein
MSKQRPSLINVLNPPGNPWLEQISRRNAKLPACVHIVRFSDDDSEELPSQQSPSCFNTPGDRMLAAG